MIELPVGHEPNTRVVTFWLSSWLGTMAAGGVFGLLVGGKPVYLLFGLMIAGGVGAATIPTAAILTWAFWLNRFRVIIAGVGGMVTAVIAAQNAFENVMGVWGNRPLFLAPWIGAFGAAAAGVLHEAAVRRSAPQSSRKGPWQFTLRDLLLRMTVLSMLMAMWAWLLTPGR